MYSPDWEGECRFVANCASIDHEVKDARGRTLGHIDENCGVRAMTVRFGEGVELTGNTNATVGRQKEEPIYEEVAAMLHGNVQSGLSACNVWLSMAEQLLVDIDPDVAVPNEVAAERILKALSLLYKVRGEVERLRKKEVQRAVERLSTGTA